MFKPENIQDLLDPEIILLIFIIHLIFYTFLLLFAFKNHHGPFMAVLMVISLSSRFQAIFNVGNRKPVNRISLT